MAQDFVGSHEKTFTKVPGAKENASGYGQNGSNVPSSIGPGASKSPIAGVSPPQAKVPSLAHADSLEARVKMDGDRAAAITAHDGMPARTTNSGSPGGTIPASTLRRDSGKSLLK
jgi:hypothetical protein